MNTHFIKPGTDSQMLHSVNIQSQYIIKTLLNATAI